MKFEELIALKNEFEQMVQRVRNELDASRSSVEYIKSDDVVDDDACDSAVVSLNNAIDMINEFGTKLSAAPTASLEPLPPSPNQEDDDDEEDDDEEDDDFVIDAEVHTDDHAAETHFDAVKWFEQASDDEIKSLAGCDWGGDYPADAVAQFMESRDDYVADVFEYLETYNNGARRETIGFECHVDSDDALCWLKKNRPELFKQITGE
jgi:hypothetical protein